MDWGMKNRLAGIFNQKSGRTVMLAVDHGYFQGPTTGLKRPGETITPLLPYCDSLFVTRGVLRNCVPANTKTPIFLRVSGGPSVLGELSNEDRTTSNLGRLVNEAEEYGMPVLAITAVGKEMARDARYLGLATRIAAEMGAHMVKTYYCEEDFEKVVEGCPVPIVIAGGKKIPERDALQMAFNAISKGAAGVDMGRNIFQSENPVAMIHSIRAVVHENYSVDEAFELFNKLKGQKIVDSVVE